MMAATAKYRDDIAGAIVTGGTSTGYTVSSYQSFDTLANLNGQAIAFTPHATNGATVTLNVDGLGAKPLRSAPATELLTGMLVQGTPYVALYNHSDQVFYLRGFYTSPYLIPIGGGLDYWGSTAPNSSFAFPTGQAISRATYSALFAIMGTTYGPGDGTTTFNLPDKTGRVSAMKEAAATRLTATGGGVDGATMGAAGGAQTRTLATANLPPYTPAGTIANGAITINAGASYSVLNASGGGGASFASGGFSPVTPSYAASQAASTFTGTAQGGTSTPVQTLPPLIVCNYIIRII
jgi:microcystin-dependent protein